MNNYINTILDEIKSKTKLTYEEIAAKLNISRKTLGRWREYSDEQLPSRIIKRIEAVFPEFIVERVFSKNCSIDMMKGDMLVALLEQDKLKIDDYINRAANLFAHKLQIVLRSYVVYKSSRCGAYPSTVDLVISKLAKTGKKVKAVIKVAPTMSDYALYIYDQNKVIFGATLTDSAIIKAIKRIKCLLKDNYEPGNK